MSNSAGDTCELLESADVSLILCILPFCSFLPDRFRSIEPHYDQSIATSTHSSKGLVPPISSPGLLLLMHFQQSVRFTYGMVS